MRDGVSLADTDPTNTLIANFDITIYHTCFSHTIDTPDDIIKNYQFQDPFESLNSVRTFTTTKPDCPVTIQYETLDFLTNAHVAWSSIFPYNNVNSPLTFREDPGFFTVEKAVMTDPALLGKR